MLNYIDPRLIVGNIYGYGTVDLDCPALIWHDGQPTEAGTAVTAATVTETADTSIALTINGAADTRIGDSASGTIADTTHLTWGSIADAINPYKGWHLQLVGQHRAGVDTVTTSGLGAVSAVTCFKTAVQLLQDSTDVLALGCGIVNAGYGKTQEGLMPLIHYMAGVSTTGAGALELWDCNDQLKTESKIVSLISATTVQVAYPIGAAAAAVPFYVGAAGNRLVIRMTGAIAGAAGTDYVSALGYMIKTF